MQSKQEVRLFFRKLQQSFLPENYLAWNLGLKPFLEEILAELPPKSLIAAYQAMPHEANLATIFGPGHRFCFPRSGENGRMDFFAVNDANNSDEFVIGKFGLREPGPDAVSVSPSEMALCFVPMVAFDPDGYRLGQGKGYYDRFLENFRGRKVGVGFSWQEAAAHIPIEAHDQPLETVVTERGIRDFPSRP